MKQQHGSMYAMNLNWSCARPRRMCNIPTLLLLLLILPVVSATKSNESASGHDRWASLEAAMEDRWKIFTPNDVVAASFLSDDMLEMIFNFLVSPTLLCFLGFASSCICQDDSLQRAILRSSTSFDNPTPIVLCAGTLEPKKAVNVTGKSFFISCGATRFWQRCSLSGGRRHRIFEGSPVQMFLQNIRIFHGNALPNTEMVSLSVMLT